jgi:bifunctional non-homologous end joining protein LigD
MLAVLAETVPRDDEHWGFEMKWDGMRALAVIEDGTVSLSSRAGNDASTRFPELQGIGRALGGVDAVLDGEIVALDDAGVPSFERLQPRMQAGSAAAVRRLAPEQPVVHMLFDVLWVAGHSTCELQYTERRAVLERLDLAGPSWQTPPTTFGGGAAVLATADQLGLEGVVAKRLDSPYLPGRRADSWRKVKPHLGQELVVGGWLHGAGRLEGHLGSLLVGYHDEAGALRFAGRVGSGIDASARAVLEARLAPLRRAAPPFVEVPRLPDPVWVEPELVVEVAFHQWTRGGVLRAPRYKGLRDDKPASEVVREA